MATTMLQRELAHSEHVIDAIRRTREVMMHPDKLISISGYLRTVAEVSARVASDPPRENWVDELRGAVGVLLRRILSI
jgi:hypothetical protein